MKIGMVGGIGPESTIDYYQRLIALYQQHVDREHYPEIVINSVDMTAMLHLLALRDWDGLSAMLLEAVEALYKAGAGLAFFASNTPHAVFERVEKRSPIPLVSIVAAAREEAEKRGLRRLGLLGTLFTMQGSYYQEEFEKSGIALVVPGEEAQQYIQHKLFSEIEQGVFLDDTREGLLAIIKGLAEEEGIDGVVLGCTELPLILTKSEYGIPFLNTTQIHARRVFDAYLKQSRGK